jgi:hypothetical protein
MPAPKNGGQCCSSPGDIYSLEGASPPALGERIRVRRRGVQILGEADSGAGPVGGCMDLPTRLQAGFTTMKRQRPRAEGITAEVAPARGGEKDLLYKLRGPKKVASERMNLGAPAQAGQMVTPPLQTWTVKANSVDTVSMLLS